MPWNDSFHRLHSIFLGSRAGGTANALLKASRFVCSTASTLQYQLLAQSRVKSCFGSVEPDRSGRHSMSTVALAAGAPPQKNQWMPWKQRRKVWVLRVLRQDCFKVIDASWLRFLNQSLFPDSQYPAQCQNPGSRNLHKHSDSYQRMQR